MDNKYTEMLAKQVVKERSDLILLAMPDNALLSRVTCVEYGHGGMMVCSFDGKPFLEIHPPVFESVYEDRSYKIKATTNYKIIKEKL